MWTKSFLLFILTAHIGNSQNVEHHETNTDARLAEGEKKISDTVLKILEHFKEPDPVGMPGFEVPDPYKVPNMKQSLTFGTLNLMNTMIYGISKFKIVSIDAEISKMVVNAILTIDAVQARGNYTLSSFMTGARGPFTVDVTGLKLEARASLGIERDGKLRAQDIIIDVTPTSINMNFENLGFIATMFQSAINSANAFFFDSIKPYILKEAYVKARTEINNKLEEVAGDMRFPNSISPLDMIISEVRKKVRNSKWDPLQVKDYNNTKNLFVISLSNTWIIGISSFHRVGNLTLKLENNSVIADFEIGTQKLEGRTQWEISAVRGLMSRAGIASFTIEYISARIIIGQSLDTRKHPEIRDLQLEIGNIQVRCDGAGTLDYAIEFVVNVLPNLLRYQIMDALESPARDWLQTKFDQIDTEEQIKEQLPKLDDMQKTGFKLSDMLIINDADEEEPYDDDPFFNF